MLRQMVLSIAGRPPFSTDTVGGQAVPSAWGAGGVPVSGIQHLPPCDAQRHTRTYHESVASMKRRALQSDSAASWLMSYCHTRQRVIHLCNGLTRKHTECPAHPVNTRLPDLSN